MSMSIIIKPEEMPQNGTRLYFATDLSGDVFARYDNDPNEPTVWFPVIEIPALMGDVRFPPVREE